jgi:hypothetical protein
LANAAGFDGIATDTFKFPTMQEDYSIVKPGATVALTADIVNHLDLGGAVNAGTYNGSGKCSTAAGTVANKSGVGDDTDCDGEFAAFAFSNVDNESKGIDAWFISSQGGKIASANCKPVNGDQISAGVPGNTYNDVECDD